MTIRLFPADGVTWVISMPCGVASQTGWPDMDWVEALAPAAAEGDETHDALEVQSEGAPGA